jgi:hypothetical protein
MNIPITIDFCGVVRVKDQGGFKELGMVRDVK